MINILDNSKKVIHMSDKEISEACFGDFYFTLSYMNI
ncbi:Uncharacterised protein [Catenibacterium mitsuokai]|nr:Uncharacterised protein [Catenibacterium mitsuokai]